MIRLALRVEREHAEVVLAELLELAPSGVEEVDLGDGTVEYAVYGPAGELPALPALRAAAGEALVVVSTSEVADDWSGRWREFHRPLLLGRRLCVRPPWEAPRDVALDVVIDPGQAFGTGAHATTRLCLELMLPLQAHGAFLDLGCGSGVLAIVAARLGWGPVSAVDNDAAALAATRGNADANGVEVEVARLDVRRQPIPRGFDTIAANLLGPLLLDWAGRIDEPPARLVAGGMLRGEAGVVAEAFSRAGLGEKARRCHGEWAALLLERQ